MHLRLITQENRLSGGEGVEKNDINDNKIYIGRLPAGLVVTDLSRTRRNAATTETREYTKRRGRWQRWRRWRRWQRRTAKTTTIADGRRTGNESLRYPHARTPSGSSETHMSAREEPPPAPQYGHGVRPKHYAFSYYNVNNIIYVLFSIVVDLVLALLYFWKSSFRTRFWNFKSKSTKKICTTFEHDTPNTVSPENRSLLFCRLSFLEFR